MRNGKKSLMKATLKTLILIVVFLSMSAEAGLLDNLQHLQKAYPAAIQSVDANFIYWQDGTKMPVQDVKQHKTAQEKLDSPSIADQLEQPYVAGKLADMVVPTTDPGRVRNETFFKKMYGDSAANVAHKLTIVYWMPMTYGRQYPLEVTTVNGVNRQLSLVSADLDKLVAVHPEYKTYLAAPAGLFLWRDIADTHRLSPHSFGIAIDLNVKHTNYWEWELEKRKLPVTESATIPYLNQIPWDIVLIFEKHGFIWGGKWRHFDTMHFEYRPEMFR